MAEVITGSGGNTGLLLVPGGNLTWTHATNPFNATRTETPWAKELSCLSNDRQIMVTCCREMDGHFLNSRGNLTADVENDRSWLHWCRVIRTDNEGEAYNAGYGQAGEKADRWKACFEENVNSTSRAEYYDDLNVNSSVSICEYRSDGVTGTYAFRPRSWRGGGGTGGTRATKLGGMMLVGALLGPIVTLVIGILI